MKSPAKVDGLLQFVNDLPDYFSPEEQSAISATEAGQKIAQSIIRCEGHSKQLVEARAKLQQIATKKSTPTKKELSDLKREVFMKKVKYVDCLAYMTCPERWKRYTGCWEGAVGRLSSAELQTWREQGALELLCRSEREALERGVGDLVASAVQAGVCVSHFDVDEFPSRASRCDSSN
jgi:hypothetical protein